MIGLGAAVVTRPRSVVAALVALVAAVLVVATLGHATAHDEVTHHLTHVTAEASDIAAPAGASYDHAVSSRLGHVDSARLAARASVLPSGMLQVGVVATDTTLHTLRTGAALGDATEQREPSRASLQVWRR